MKLNFLALTALLHSVGSSRILAAALPETNCNGQPNEIRSVDGLLEAVLTVSQVTTPELGHIAPGYNHSPVGPTLRAKPGDTIRITLINDLEPSPAKHLELSLFAMTPIVDDEANKINQTILVNRLVYPTGNMQSLPAEDYWGKLFQNLHFHGLNVDPTVDDSRTYIDGGGERIVYEFDIPEDAPPLFGFYHNHVHGTAVYSFLSGLYGFFVIEDPNSGPMSSYIASTPDASEHFLLLSESMTNDEDAPVDFIPIVMAFDWDHVTNGQINPIMTFKKGERVHFRAVNAGVEPSMTLSIEGHTLIAYAMDGYPVPMPEEADSIELDTGARAEFVVKFDAPGEYKFKRGSWNAGIVGEGCQLVFGIPAATCISFDKETDVATIVVLEEEIDAEGNIEEWDPTISVANLFSRQHSDQPMMHPYLESLLALPMAGSREITFDQAHHFPIFQILYNGPFVPPGAGFGVNSRLFNPHYFHGNIVGGTCEDWTVQMIESPFHTVHIHSVPFFVTSKDGIELNATERFWRDTYTAMYNFTATVCFPPRDIESYINVHCHMPQHQDIGMAAFYKLLPSRSTSSSTTQPNDTKTPIDDETPFGTKNPVSPTETDADTGTVTPIDAQVHIDAETPVIPAEIETLNETDSANVTATPTGSSSSNVLKASMITFVIVTSNMFFQV